MSIYIRKLLNSELYLYLRSLTAVMGHFKKYTPKIS